MDIVTYPKARFEIDKLIIDDNTDYDTWKKLGSSLRQLEKSYQFWIADWLKFGYDKGFTGKRIDTETYKQAEMITGYHIQTLKNIHSVAEKIPSTVRRSELSFAHHAEIANLDVEVQKNFLEEAVVENLSVKNLREKVNEYKRSIRKPRRKQAAENKLEKSRSSNSTPSVDDSGKVSFAHHNLLFQLPEEVQKEFMQRITDENMTVEDLRVEVRDFLLDYTIKEKKIFDLPQMRSHPNWKEYFRLLADELVTECSEEQLDYLTNKLL